MFTRLYNASVQSFGLNTGLMVMPERVCSTPLTGGWTWVYFTIILMSWLVFQNCIWSQSRFVEQGVYFESAGFPICVTTVLGCSPCIFLPSVPTPLSGLNTYFEKYWAANHTSMHPNPLLTALLTSFTEMEKLSLALGQDWTKSKFVYPGKLCWAWMLSFRWCLL